MKRSHPEHQETARASRRRFLKVLAMAGLLAGCRGLERALPTLAPSPHPTKVPSPPPTGTPSPPPTARPTDTATTAPTATAVPTEAVTRGRHTVAYARHAGAWQDGALVPQALEDLLDTAITTLTGQGDPAAAWASCFDPSERIAIKVNTIQGSYFWTRVPLVKAVTDRLQQIGVPAEQIVVFDRSSMELTNANYVLNRSDPGVRCYGTDDDYQSGWQIMDVPVDLSRILLECDALINMPILKHHGMAGISFAMKNHYGTFNRPYSFHQGEAIERGIGELNALPPIRERARLIIGDVLSFVHLSWTEATPGDGILMSFEPVTHDTAGLQIASEFLAAQGKGDAAVRAIAERWLAHGAALGLGTDDPALINLLEVQIV